MDYQQPFSTIQADANNISKESLDCGIKSLNWCNGARCQSLATIKNFIISLSAIGILQGAIESYFRISVKQAAINLKFDSTVLEWLLVSGGIMQACIALLLTYWSQKYHPMSWLSGFVLLQSSFSFLAIIPTLDNLGQDENVAINNTQINEFLQENESLSTEPLHSTTTLILLFVLQFSIALGSTAFYTIGINYIDDNTKSSDAPAFIGTAMCAYICGSQLGVGISLFVTATTIGWWLGWAVLSPFLFTCGILIGLFPRKLLKTVVRQAANRIAERTSRNSLFQETFYLQDFAFMPSLKRLLTNRILIFNLVAVLFIETVAINYFLNEQNYLQSRYFLPTSEANGLLDEWTSRFVTYLLRPPVVGICILVSGLIISKVHPKGRSLALWNICISVMVCLAYIGYIFINCSANKIAGAHRGRITQPYCSKDKVCNADVFFSPTCPANGKLTYFSPCHAGCSSEILINNFALYQNCTCGTNIDEPITNGIATGGACNMNDCQSKWITFQIITIVVACLLGTTKIGRIIISLRSVLPQDKPMALALELFLTGIAAYIPGKLGYNVIGELTCHYWSLDKKICFLQESPTYGNALNICSAILMFISLIFDVFVFVYAKKLDCFTQNNNDKLDFLVPLQNISHNIDNDSTVDPQNRQEENGENEIQLIRGSPRFFGRIKNDERLTDNNNTEITSPSKIDNEEILDFHMRNSTLESETDQEDENQIMETKALINSIPNNEIEITKTPNSPETDF